MCKFSKEKGFLEWRFIFWYAHSVIWREKKQYILTENGKPVPREIQTHKLLEYLIWQAFIVMNK